MNSKLKKFLFISATLYVAFLGWFFLGIKPNMSRKWNPSDIYSQVGDCPYATSATTTPSSDPIFEAKTAVPMKSVTASRKGKRKRRSSMPVAKSALGKRNPSLYSFAVTPIGGGLHMVSAAEFRPFGAEGLMYMPMPQYLKRDNNNYQSSAGMPMILPYMAMPTESGAASGAESAMVVPSFSVVNTPSMR